MGEKEKRWIYGNRDKFPNVNSLNHLTTHAIPCARHAILEPKRTPSRCTLCD